MKKLIYIFCLFTFVLNANAKTAFINNSDNKMTNKNSEEENKAKLLDTIKNHKFEKGEVLNLLNDRYTNDTDGVLEVFEKSKKIIPLGSRYIDLISFDCFYKDQTCLDRQNKDYIYAMKLTAENEEFEFTKNKKNVIAILVFPKEMLMDDILVKRNKDEINIVILLNSGKLTIHSLNRPIKNYGKNEPFVFKSENILIISNVLN